MANPSSADLCLPRQFFKTNADAAVPVALGTGLATSLEFVGQKAKYTDNTGIIGIQFTSVNADPARAIAAGGNWSITAPPGQKFDLSQIFLDVITADDGVLVSVIP